MRFTWDERKNRANKAKHGVSFEVAQRVLDDPLHVSYPDGSEHGEERWETTGLADPVVLLVVIHTYESNGEEFVRIISARRASRRERQRYEQGT
jgi:uncharacterized DUF497 family protein